jgi:SHS family lactate transporter-like MFS transporter
MALFMLSYHSLSFWYPTFLRQIHLSPLQYVLALNVGGILGAALWGWVSETRLGRRGAVTFSALASVLFIPIYLEVRSPFVLLGGALLMGVCGLGTWGIVPSYLTERFPTAARAVGPGFAYHAGAVVGSLTPVFIGFLQDRGIRLQSAMAACTLTAGLLIASVIWLGPETRGQPFTPAD